MNGTGTEINRLRRRAALAFFAIVAILLFPFAGGLAFRAWENQTVADEIATYSKRIAADPASVEDYVKRAALYGLVGKYKMAIADCDQALKLAPSLAAAHQVRGKAYLFSGELEEALNDFNDAIILAPEDASGYESRALVWIKMGNLDKGRQDVLACISKGGDPGPKLRFLVGL